MGKKSNERAQIQGWIDLPIGLFKGNRSSTMHFISNIYLVQKTLQLFRAFLSSLSSIKTCSRIHYAPSHPNVE